MAFEKEPVHTSDAGQPGTEIFNMPASTTAGNHVKSPPIKYSVNLLCVY